MLDGNAVRSVDRAASLLIALGETQGEAGVTELARRRGLHKSTASRLLATLEKRGLVEQDDVKAIVSRKVATVLATAESPISRATSSAAFAPTASAEIAPPVECMPRCP